VQLVPAYLSKTDKAGRTGPLICLRSWREDESLCPVAVIRALMEARDALDIRHNRLFFNTRRPDSIVSLKTFRGFITRSLRDAGIDAPLGSTRATAAPSTLGGGVAIGDIVRMGNWSASSTFHRHYATLGQVSEHLCEHSSHSGQMGHLTGPRLTRYGPL
jgi:hypothetical protein